MIIQLLHDDLQEMLGKKHEEKFYTKYTYSLIKRNDLFIFRTLNKTYLQIFIIFYNLSQR